MKTTTRAAATSARADLVEHLDRGRRVSGPHRRIPVVDGGRPVGVFSLGDAAMERDPFSALAETSTAPGNA